MAIGCGSLFYELYAQWFVVPLSLFLIALIGLHLLNKEAGGLGWVATLVTLIGLVLLLAHFLSESRVLVIASVSNFETLLLGFGLLGGGLLLSGVAGARLIDYGERLPPRNLLSLVTGLLALLFISLIDIPKESTSWLVEITRVVGGLLGAGFLGLGASISAAPTFGSLPDGNPLGKIFLYCDKMDS